MDVIASILLGVSISATVFLFGQRLRRRTRKPNPKPTRSLMVAPRFGRWTTALAGVIPVTNKQREHLNTELLAIGKYHATARDDFLASRNLISLSSILLVSWLFASGLLDGREIPGGIASVILIVSTYSLPRVLLSSRASRCNNEMEKGIPDALDMIAMAVAGGISLEAAVARTANQLRSTHARLSQELAIVARQAKTGSIESAFAAFGDRIDLPEVAAWCSLMAQSRRLGGRIVHSLNEYSNRIRTDRKNRAERRGNTASIKLLLPVVTCLSPPIAIMLIGPAFLDFRDFINRKQDDEVVVNQSVSPEQLQRPALRNVRQPAGSS